MSKPKKEYRVTIVEVTGRGRFPFDMLRYDNCVPVEGINQLTEREERTIRLRRFSQDGTPATAARWNSFGWGVTRDSAKGVQ